jgi:hypothetical protein
MLKGSCGNTLNQLAFYRSEIGTCEGPTTFCAGCDSTVWIADSYNHLMKRFDRTGNVTQYIQLDSTSVVDDMSCNCRGKIVFRDWSNRDFLPLVDSAGSILAKCPLVKGGASWANAAVVTIGDSGIYCLYMDSSGSDIGLRFGLDGDLVEVRRQNLRLWAQTAGRYYVPDGPNEAVDAWDSFDPREIRRSDGSTFLTDSTAFSPWAHAIGVDASGNLYLSSWKNRGDEVRFESFVSVYHSTGKNLVMFPVRRFADIIADGHFPKVGPNGDVYVLTVSDDLTSWTLYRYTVRE